MPATLAWLIHLAAVAASTWLLARRLGRPALAAGGGLAIGLLVAIGMSMLTYGGRLYWNSMMLASVAELASRGGFLWKAFAFIQCWTIPIVVALAVASIFRKKPAAENITE